MPSTVQPMVITADIDRLSAFYAGVAGATVTARTPPVAIDGAPAGRLILSIAVPDVDAAVPAAERLGGSVTGGPSDMPWGQRVAPTTNPDGDVVNLTTTRPA